MEKLAPAANEMRSTTPRSADEWARGVVTSYAGVVHQSRRVWLKPAYGGWGGEVQGAREGGGGQWERGTTTWLHNLDSTRTRTHVLGEFEWSGVGFGWEIFLAWTLGAQRVVVGCDVVCVFVCVCGLVVKSVASLHHLHAGILFKSVGVMAARATMRPLLTSPTQL
uniref:Uncharacterized protein n=1 Tax=Knipowitschia caucasica TaxID=637954 RepID=A0AAV2JEB9_KNICA